MKTREEIIKEYEEFDNVPSELDVQVFEYNIAEEYEQ